MFSVMFTWVHNKHEQPWKHTPLWFKDFWPLFFPIPPWKLSPWGSTLWLCSLTFLTFTECVYPLFTPCIYVWYAMIAKEKWMLKMHIGKVVDADRTRSWVFQMNFGHKFQVLRREKVVTSLKCPWRESFHSFTKTLPNQSSHSSATT